MKNKNEAIAALGLMYILKQYELEQDVFNRVKQLFIEAEKHLRDNNDSVEDVMQEAIKVLEKFVKSKGVK